MIACPICAGDTQVVETRKAKSGTRRRRRCNQRGCPGKVTTIELVICGKDYKRDGLVLVPIAKLQQMAALLADYVTVSAPVVERTEETPCVSPED